MKQINVTLIYLDVVEVDRKFSNDVKSICLRIKWLSLSIEPVVTNRDVRVLKKKFKFKDLPCLWFKEGRMIERIYGRENILNKLREFKDGETERRIKEQKARERAKIAISRKQQAKKLRESKTESFRRDPIQSVKRDLVRHVRSRSCK